MNALRSTYCLLLTTILFAVACGTPKAGRDPLAGWKPLPSQDPKKLDKAIRDDYENYLQTLSPRDRYVAHTELLEDGTGRHAVRIEIPFSGIYWQHVLIYDQNNRRVQALKRDAGHYGDNYW